MAGYAGTPLERRKGIKPDHVVYLDSAPDSFDLDVPTTRRLPRQLDIGLATGVVDVKVRAIDGVWSGLKFVRRLEDRA